jgi:hypothetical protein
MTKWKEIGVQDLYTYLAVAQVDALRRASIGDHDPVCDIIFDVISNVRANISSNKKNILSKRTNAVPPELKSVVCILILEHLQARIPGFKLTDDQIRIANDARMTVQKIARGEIYVSIPDDGMYESARVAVLSSRRHEAYGSAMKGL